MFIYKSFENDLEILHFLMLINYFFIKSSQEIFLLTQLKIEFNINIQFFIEKSFQVLLDEKKMFSDFIEF